jgi:hypothetical protein
LNLLSFEAMDRAGHRRHLQRSFFYAPKYQKEEDAIASFSLNIAQRFLEAKGGGRSHLLALLEDLVNAADLGVIRIPRIRGVYAIPPFGNELRYEVLQRDAMRVERIKTSLRFLADGAWSLFSMERFVLPLDIKINESLQRITVDARRLHFSLWFQIKRDEAGHYRVEMPYSYVDLSGLRILGITGLLSWFRGTIEQRVREGVRAGLLGAMRERFLPALRVHLEALPKDWSWPLPAQLGGRRMRSRLALSRLSISPEALEVALRLRLGCEQSAFSSARESAPRLPDVPAEENRASLAFGVAVDDLNQAFFALWRCGALSHELSEAILPVLSMPQLPFAMPRLKLSLHTHLPPLFMPGDARYPLALGLGGVRIALSWGEAAMGGSLLAEIGLIVGVRTAVTAKGEIALIFAPKPLAFSLRILEQRGSKTLSHEDWEAFLSGFLLQSLPDALRIFLQQIALPKEGDLSAIPSLYRSFFQGLRVLPRRFLFDGQRLRVGLDLRYSSPVEKKIP